MERSETMTGSAVSPRPYVGQDASPRYPAPEPVPPRPRFTPHPPPVPRSHPVPPPVFGPQTAPAPQSAPHPQFAPRPRFTPHSWPSQGQPVTQGPRPVHGPARQAARPAPARQRPPRRPGRSVIGDELRIPIMWCEFGTCIERYTDADALGERDLRHRALTAGWCYDLLGRLACPACVQHDETFWASRPPVPAQRY